MIGIASENNSPYYIDFMSSSAAKNLYLIAKSGAGKTFMGQTILLDAFTKNFNVCAMDIKGTELGAFTRACGGKTLQLRSTSTTYINTYKLESKDVKNGEYRIYFNKMFNATKVRLQIMAGVENDPKYETLFDKFLRALYTTKILGIVQSNWIHLLHLTTSRNGLVQRFRKNMVKSQST